MILAALNWIKEVIKSLAQVFVLSSLKGRIEGVEGRFDSDYIKLDKRLDARNKEMNEKMGGLAERIAHLEGRNTERDSYYAE